MVSLLLHTLALPVCARTCCYGASFTFEVLEMRKEVGWKSAPFSCLEDLSMLVF
jgi:hypothetical protein